MALTDDVGSHFGHIAQIFIAALIASTLLASSVGSLETISPGDMYMYVPSPFFLAPGLEAIGTYYVS